MADEKDTGGDDLSADDRAFFESGGKDNAAPAPRETPAKEAPAAKAEEQEPDDLGEAPEPKENERRQRTVPHEALHEERTRRQKVEASLQEERLKAARLEERMNMLLRMQQRQAPQPQQQRAQQEEVPDPEKDPVGALKYYAQQQQAMQQRQQKQAAEAQKQAAAKKQLDEVVGAAKAEFAAYAKEDPQAQAQYEHIISQRKAELKAYGLSDQDVAKRVAAEELTALVALRQKRIPIKNWITSLATARGYRPAEPQQPDPAARLQQQARAQAAGKTLSGAGSESRRLTAVDIDKMSDAEYSKFLDRADKDPSLWRRYVGAR